MNEFHEGDYVIYVCGDRYQIGSKTPFVMMHKLENAYVIGETSLGGRMT